MKQKTLNKFSELFLKNRSQYGGALQLKSKTEGVKKGDQGGRDKGEDAEREGRGKGERRVEW